MTTKAKHPAKKAGKASKPQRARKAKGTAEKQAEALNAKPAGDEPKKERKLPEIVIYVPPGSEERRGPGGRPTVYNPAMCAVVEELGKAGKSRAQIAAALDVAIITTREWEDRFPEFAASMKRARDYALAWWEEAGQSGMFMMGFNATAWSLQVRNRFPDDYRDRKEVEHSGTVQHEARVAERAERLRMIRERREQEIGAPAHEARERAN